MLPDGRRQLFERYLVKVFSWLKGIGFKVGQRDVQNRRLCRPGRRNQRR
jgi:hypothetical protein